MRRGGERKGSGEEVRVEEVRGRDEEGRGRAFEVTVDVQLPAEDI